MAARSRARLSVMLEAYDKMSKPMKEAAKSSQGLADAVKKTSATVGDANTKMSKLGGGGKSAFGQMAKANQKANDEISKLNNRLDKSNRSLQKIGSNTSSINRLTRAFAGLGSAMVAIGGGKALIGSTIGGAMKKEQNLMSMEHFIGLNNKDQAPEMAKDYMEWLRTNANSTPFETGEVMNIGRRAIVATQGDLGMATELVKVAENMAAVNPEKSLMASMEAIADLMVGEVERMKEFGFKLTAEQLKAAGGGSAMKGAQKLLVTDIADTFDGAADKLAQSGAGLMSTIAGTFKSGLQDMGDQSLEILKPELKVMADYMMGGGLIPFIEWGSKAMAMVTKVAINIGKALLPIGQSFRDIGLAISTSFKGGDGKSMLETLGINQGVANLIHNISVGMSDLTFFVSGLFALLNGNSTSGNNFLLKAGLNVDEISGVGKQIDIIKEKFLSFSDSLSPLVGNLMTIGGQLGSELFSGFMKHLPQILDLGEKLVDVATKLTNLILDNWDQVIELSKTFLTIWATAKIGKGGFDLFKNIGGKAKGAKTTVTGMGTTLAKFGDDMIKVGDKGGWLSKIFGGKIAGSLGKFGGVIKNIAGPAFAGLAGLIGVKGLLIVAAIGLVVAGIYNMCQRFKENSSKSETYMSELAASVQAKTDLIKKAMDETGIAIDSVFGKKYTMLLDTSSVDKVMQRGDTSTIFKTNPISKPDGTHKSGLNNVPFNGYVAKLHKGERVLTAQENKDLNKSTSGVTITGNTFHVRQESDIDAIADALFRKLSTTKVAMG